ncbi:testis-expressed protein 11 [Pleurodeles waltl]|uniref:testis-expressed protein 11 n=1 Tax=Pleurodeles waltl TaxID=8319 RepID=UPI0037097817
MERISSFTEIKELIQDLVANDTTLDPGEIINKLCSTVTTLDEDLEHSAQVEECAIKLWNWGMTKRIGSVINNEERAKCDHSTRLPDDSQPRSLLIGSRPLIKENGLSSVTLLGVIL